MIARPGLQVEALREALASLLESGSPQTRSLRRSAEALSEPPFGDAFSERVRVALHRLIGLHDEGVIVVASPQRKEGRSSVAAAMAGVLARARGAGQRVLLLDLDFRRSGLAAMFSVAPTPGLADYLEDREQLRAVSREPGRDLWLIPAGNHLGDPARLMHQIAEPGVFSIFRDYFDWVVIDVPPILDHPEVTALAPLADWHVVVGRHRRTLMTELSKVQALLGEGPSGFLLTGDSTRMPAWLRRLL